MYGAVMVYLIARIFCTFAAESIAASLSEKNEVKLIQLLQ